MAASLNIFYDLSLVDPAQFKDLTGSFVSILKQVIEHRLPREFDYHKVGFRAPRRLRSTTDDGYDPGARPLVANQADEDPSPVGSG